MSPTRPLVLVDRSPLPAVSGGRQRMWSYLLAVDSLGPADLVLLDGSDDSFDELVEALPSWKIHKVPVVKRPRSTATRVIEVARARRPSSLAALDVEGAARAVRHVCPGPRPVLAVQAIAADVALCLDPSRDSTVVDLWDVEDVRLRRQIATSPRFGWAPRAWWRRLEARSDVRAWRRFHRALIEQVSLVTICSDVDRAALPPSPRVCVVPNGANVPDELPPRHPKRPPIVLFQGQNTYAPNVEAAQILARQVRPHLLAAMPDVRIRIVGRVDDRVLELHEPPGVVVTGFVADIEPELAAASVLVVPLRVGGGTRLKILEAFAHGIPVVSTTVGAEGLAVEHGRHLLIGDDPAAIASQTLDVLADAELRRRLASEAFDLVRSQYDWRSIREDLAQALVLHLGRRPTT